MLFELASDEIEIHNGKVLAGKEITNPVTNPIGCNVKWEAQDAHWMPPEACDLV